MACASLASMTSKRRCAPLQILRNFPIAISASSLPRPRKPKRSEEHTSELQSRGHLVCRLLLEKKKKRKSRMSSWVKFYCSRIYLCCRHLFLNVHCLGRGRSFCRVRTVD